MFRLIETICVKNKVFLNLDYHDKRFTEARKKLFSQSKVIDLKKELVLPGDLKNDTYRCRVIYEKEICGIEFFPYEKKKIHSLKLVASDEIDYSFKWENRLALEELLKKKENCDEIIIIKEGFVTDCSFANLAFFDGRHWVTPEKPLLKGTKREKLLREKIIKEAKIKEQDLKSFQKVSLINAMLDLEDLWVDMSRIC